MTSEVRNRSIPRTTLLMPPEVSWLSPATGLLSVVVRPVWVVIGSVLARRDGRGRGDASGSRAVADVEHRSLRADVRQSIEVVRRRWRRRGPLEGIALPWVVAGDLATAQRDEDVPQQG